MNYTELKNCTSSPVIRIGVPDKQPFYKGDEIEIVIRSTGHIQEVVTVDSLESFAIGILVSLGYDIKPF